MSFEVSGHIVDPVSNRTFPGCLHVVDGLITSIEEQSAKDVTQQFILPGMIDSHLHIESSMLIPSEFAAIAVTHGTVGVVADPHEIANVLGISGVKFMIDNAKDVPFHFNFGAPSCVPATPFETSGASLGVEETKQLLAMDEVCALSEMMNVPGVLMGDEEVHAKIQAALDCGKPVDGHAPGISGEHIDSYFKHVSTDHECTSFKEGLEKIERGGIFVQIREGSAAKDFEELVNLFNSYPDHLMFCSDDKHPDDLVRGHILNLVKRAVIDHGCDLYAVLRAASVIPSKHYNLRCGFLQPSQSADFVIVKDLTSFDVMKTFVKGECVFENGAVLFDRVTLSENVRLNTFRTDPISLHSLQIQRPPVPKTTKTTRSDEDEECEESERVLIKAITVKDGSLLTGMEKVLCHVGKDCCLVSSVEDDLLKIVVVNRYEDTANVSVAFVKGFGFQKGAMASSVAHDSHNIIAVGTNDDDLVTIVNTIISVRGGVGTCIDGEVDLIELPIAGIMTDEVGSEVAEHYERLNNKAANIMKCPMKAAFMTLSFMGLLVIPVLKLSDKGLFNGETFSFTSLFEESE
jgi:adenine deaminase